MPFFQENNFMKSNLVRWKYKFLAQDDLEKSIDNESSEQLLDSTSSSAPRPSTPRNLLWIIWLNIALFILSLVLIVVSFSRLNSLVGRNALLKQTSFFSPVLDIFDLPTQPELMNGTLFPTDNPSLSRQFPSPDVEAFWDQYETQHAFPISSADVVRLGKTPREVVHFPESFGHGDDAFMGQVDVFHQIHCLNSLRKVAFKDYEPYPTKLEMHQPALYWVHMAHCVDMLYQNLRCTGNLDIITYNWKETQQSPFPDFNIYHQCRDWDAIMEFHNTYRITQEQWMSLRRPDDPSEYIEVPQEEGYWKIFGHDGNTDLSHHHSTGGH